MTRLLRENTDFRRLWFGSAVSALGSWLLVVAVPVQVFRLTHSVVSTGLTVALESLPAVLVGPWAGVFVDRWSRRRTMIVADLVSAAAVAAMVLADRPGRIPLLYAAVVVENVAVVFNRPAARAAIPRVVGTGPGLARANGLAAGAAGVARLAGPPLGALLLTGGGFAVAARVDAATYLVSAAATGLVTTALGPSRRAGPRVRDLAADLRDGFGFIVATPPLRGALASSWLFLVGNGGLTALLVPFTVERLTGRGADLGYVIAGLGVGYLAGAAAAPRLIARLPTGALLAGAQAATGLCFLALFNARDLPLATAAAAAAALPGAVYLVTVQHLVQVVTPDAVLGRVAAAFSAGDAAAAVVGSVAGPALAAAVGLPAGLNLLGLAVVVTAASALPIGACAPATEREPGAAAG
jgi:MFS family permease